MFQDLQKTDLYRLHSMSDDFDGGCFSIDISKVSATNDQEIYQLLDAACRLSGLQPISNSWRNQTFDEGTTMLQWGFQNDLVFDGPRLGKKKTNKYMKLILNHVNPEEAFCFTNWSDDPWNEGGSRSWSSLSHATFEIAVVVMDKNTLVLTYLTAED